MMERNLENCYSDQLQTLIMYQEAGTSKVFQFKIHTPQIGGVAQVVGACFPI
jgi:hypothetical protein